MALNRVQIGNMALAEVPAPTIAELDEDSLEAAAVRTHYDPALQLLLEAHDWDFAIRRGSLAEITNDRTDDHSYAYSVPSDMASPRGLYPADGGTAGGVTLLAGQMAASPGYWPAQAMDEHLALYPFTIANGKIYTSLETATLEYVTNDVSESAFPALFAYALALELAARIVMTLKQDPKRQSTIRSMAEIARERAIADNLNRQPRQQYGFVSQDALSRMWGP